MKKHRLLALVLCFVMVFGDMTSTFASTLPGTSVVTTDASETDTSETEKTDVSTTNEEGGTEVTVPSTEKSTEQSTEQPTQSAEVSKTDETETPAVEETEQEGILVEEEKEIKNVKSTGVDAVSVSYDNGTNVEKYDTPADAKAAIEAYLNTNTSFSGEIRIQLLKDVNFSGNDFALERDNAYLRLDLNGRTATMTADAYVRANIESCNGSMGTIKITNNGILSLFPTSNDPSSASNVSPNGVTFTNIYNVKVETDASGTGTLILGEKENQYGLVKRSLQVTDVTIGAIKDLTIQGDVNYVYTTGSGVTATLNVAGDVRIDNGQDFDNNFFQQAWIRVPITCTNLYWNGEGVVTDMTVSEKLETNAGNWMEVRKNLTVKDIEVTSNGNQRDSFNITRATVLDGDNGNAVISTPTITISGNVTVTGGTLDQPIGFQKAKRIQTVDSYGNINEQYENDIFEVDEVLATALNADESAFRLNQDMSAGNFFVQKMSDGRLVVKEIVVEVALWNESTWNNEKRMYYGSIGEAVAGISSDFDGAVGQYNISLYDDVTLAQDVVLPDYVQKVNVFSCQNRYQDSNGNDYDVTYFVTMDFNGHSFTTNGNMIEWSESVRIRNNASDTKSEIVVNTNNGAFHFNCVDENKQCQELDGTPIDRSNGLICSDGVDIRVPNGSVDLNVNGTTWNRTINAEVTARKIGAFDGNWIIRDAAIVENGDSIFIGEEANLTITGTTTLYGDTRMHVRGEVSLNDIVVKAKNNDAYQSAWIQLVKGYDRSNNNRIYCDGKAVLNGTITTEGLEDASIGIEKSEIYRTFRGNNADGYPEYDEQYNWDVAFEEGEVLAIVNNPAIKASMFRNSKCIFAIEEQKLKAYQAAVSVELFGDEENPGISYSYRSFDDAIAGLTNDFGKQEGHYNIILLKDVTLTKDVEIPAFVKELSVRSEEQWVQETEEQGHCVVIFTTMDFNGCSFISNGSVFWSEAVKVVNSKKDQKSEIKLNGEDWLCFCMNSVDESVVCLGTNESVIDRTKGYTWINGVDINVSNGKVELNSEEVNWTRTINANITANQIEVCGGLWKVNNLTMNDAGCGSFISETAGLTVTGLLQAYTGSGISVRGKAVFGDIKVDASNTCGDDCFWLDVETLYDRDNDNELLSKGTIEFTGKINAGEGMYGSLIRLSKREIYRYEKGTDEWGNPRYDEDHFDLAFSSGETAATIKNSTITAGMFKNDEGLFVIEGQALNAYQAAVVVDYFVEEEDRGISYSYRTLEEAFTNMAKDFGSREGEYNITFLSDVQMKKNLTVPSFVKNLRLHAKNEWIEHRDEEGNPIEIRDENGNFMGTEGHLQVQMTTLDMNGFTLTSAAPLYFGEGLSVVSKVATKGKITVTAKTGEGYDEYNAVLFEQFTDVEFADAEGNRILRNNDYNWKFVDNVDVTASYGNVQLQSFWGTYIINGTITAKEIAVSGKWEVDKATVTKGLFVQTGGYDAENDFGWPDGDVTFNNLTADGAFVENGGKLFVNGTFTAKNSEVYNHTFMKVDTLEMATGYFDNRGEAWIKNANIKEFCNRSRWEHIEDDPNTVDVNEEKNVEIGALFICDTFKQPTTGSSAYLEGCSTFVVNNKADFYNLYIGGENGGAENPANIYRMENAVVTVNGSVVNYFDWIKLCIGIFDSPDEAVGFGMVPVYDKDEQGEICGYWYEVAFIDAEGEAVSTFGEERWPFQTLSKNRVLLVSNVKNFPTEAIVLDQKEEGAKYWSAYQKGTQIRVGGNWINILTEVDGNVEWLRTFSNWDEAATFITGLSNPNISYIIEISEDLDIEGNLVFPAKAKSVKIVGTKEDDSRVKLTYTGDIKLNSDVEFINLDLDAVTSGKEYHSTVTLNGHAFILANVKADFTSITGTSASVLGIYENSEITVDKTIKTLQTMEVFDATLIVSGTGLRATDAAISGVKDLNVGNAEVDVNNGTVTITGDTVLSIATIKTNYKITLNNVYSLDDGNKIIYGGNGTNNILTINGYVYGPTADDEYFGAYAGDAGMIEVSGIYAIAGESEEPTAFIRAAAIDISVETLVSSEAGYQGNDVLLNASKAAAEWFVVGSTYNEDGARTEVTGLTHKAGTKILYGTGAGTVQLLKYDGSIEDYTACGSYATLQDAFDEIERIADKEGVYELRLRGDVGSLDKSISTPSKAAFVAVWSYDGVRTISYNNELKLNSNVLFDGVILNPQSTSNKITLNNYKLDLVNGTKPAEGKTIGAIAGSGVTKDSGLCIHNTSLTVAGNVENIGWLSIESAELTVNGKINVGDIAGWVDEEIPEDGRITPTIIGTATVKRSTTGVVTAVTPQITINGEMSYDDDSLVVALQEKKPDGTYVMLDFSADEMADVLAKGIQLAKAPKVSSMMILLSEENNADTEAYTVAKVGGYLTYQSKENVGVSLYYRDSETGNDIYTSCKTFADAVTEINNLKTKQVYGIELLSTISAISKEAPTALTMPAKNMVETLYIAADEREPAPDLYYTGNISFASDVDLDHINFVQVAKDSKGKYVSVNELKNGYPAAVTVSTGGYTLDISGKVSFNTPINLDGAKKGTLNIVRELRTYTNEGLFVGEVPEEAYVCGSIKNFAEVNLRQDLWLVESKNGKNYTTPSISATTLNVNDSELVLSISGQTKAKIDVTNLNTTGDSFVSMWGDLTSKNTVLNENSKISATNKLALTNVTLNDAPMLFSGKDFTISGTLTSNTADAVLCTVQKTNGAPYLNITGKVELTKPELIERENKIQVGVFTSSEGSEMPLLTGSPSATGMLLNAKTATADMFVPYVWKDEEGNFYESNVGEVGAYSDENTNGYFLMKSGTGIYVYYGDQLGVALYKGEDLENAELLGYYSGLKEAVAAIDALKDKEATYTLLLMKDVNSATAPAAITLPTQAAEVIIAGKTSTENIYFTGNITLKCNTCFENVTFQPYTTQKAATTFDIVTSTYDLTLKDVAVGTTNGMALKNINGNAKQDTFIDSADLVIKGNVTGSDELIVSADTTVNGNVKAAKVTLNGITLTVGGTFTADELTMSDATLDAQKNAVTVKNIVNSGTTENTIMYGKSTAKPYGPNLKITGTVSSNNGNPIVLKLVADGATKDSYTIKSVGVKYTLSDNQKLAVIEKAPMSNFTMKLNEEELLPTEVVKANKGVYITGIDSLAHVNGTCLKMNKGGVDYTTYCLDFTQAVNEINTIADKEADYTILIGRMPTADVDDVNLTDTYELSTITMPKANMANSVTIAYDGAGRIGMAFKGNITYAGNLGLKNLDFDASGISSVKTLTLDNTDLFTTGTVSVTDVVVKGDSSWDAFGKTTVKTLDVSGMTDGYLASKLDAKTLVPTFTISGDVTLNAERKPIVWKVIAAAAKAENIQYVLDTEYENVGLVVAPKASADAFIAEPFASEGFENAGSNNYIAYKDTKNAVKNGKWDEMQVKLTINGSSTTYAKSFEEAVAIINNAADTNAKYEMELLKAEIKTTKNGTAYGALTLPTKAAMVTIKGQLLESGEPGTVLAYTGGLKPNCNVKFEDIVLKEGTVKNGVFTPTYKVTPDLSSKAIELVFGENTVTLKKENDTETADIVMTSISGSKGTVSTYVDAKVLGKVSVMNLVVIGDKDVTVVGDISVTGMHLDDVSTVTSTTGKITAKEVVVHNTDATSNAVIDGTKAITLTNISGEDLGEGDGLRINTDFTTITKATQQTVTQLAINGAITDVKVDIATDLYDLNTKSYYGMTAEDAKALLITDESKAPASNQKIATLPKATTDSINILVLAEEWSPFTEVEGTEEEGLIPVTLVKHEGGLYMTSLPAMVELFGNKGEGMIYNTNFLSWEQAVKEIDRIADTNMNYVMDVKRNVGQKLDGEISPIKTLTLPTKAKLVTVTGENIFFTGTTVTVKCDTAFEHVGLMAVKLVKQNGYSWYESTSYNMNIGNYDVVMNSMRAHVEFENAGWYESAPGTISGSKNGSLTFLYQDSPEEEYLTFPALKISNVGTVEFYSADNEERDYTPAWVPSGMSGVENLIVHPDVYLGAWDGAISVKNLKATGSIIGTKNLTVTGTTELESAFLATGTETVGDGILKLANVVLYDDNCGIVAKQDKNGKSLMQITGTVTAGEGFVGETEGALQVEIYYNNDSCHAQLYDGMLLLTAPKADASWFVPFYSFTVDKPLRDENGNQMYDENGKPLYEREQKVDEEGRPVVDESGNPVYVEDEEGNPVYVQETVVGMGWPREGYGVYKSKNAIYYGALAE